MYTVFTGLLVRVHFCKLLFIFSMSGDLITGYLCISVVYLITIGREESLSSTRNNKTVTRKMF